MQFSHPRRGIGVIAIFLAVAPPIELIVAAYMGHSFVGGRQVLFEIGEVFSQQVIPFLLSSYSFYMPPVFFAAIWAAFRPANGLALTLGGSILRTVIAGLVCEFVYQLFVIIAGGGFKPDVIMVSLVQSILAGAVCWAVAKKFKLAKNIK